MSVTPHPILVDTTSLLAYCKTNYAESLFQTLTMTTTNVCNEEAKRQKGNSDRYEHNQACERYLELLTQEKNPDVYYVEAYKSYVEDQGEQTLESVFRSHPSTVKFILLFDFDAIESFNELKSEIGGDALNTKIALPNYAFEILRNAGDMTTEEYCKATYQMGVAENWMEKHALKFNSVSEVNCPQFP